MKKLDPAPALPVCTCDPGSCADGRSHPPPHPPHPDLCVHVTLEPPLPVCTCDPGKWPVCACDSSLCARMTLAGKSRSKLCLCVLVTPKCVRGWPPDPLNMDEYVIGPSPIAKFIWPLKIGRTLCCHYCMYSRMGIDVYGQPYRILESTSSPGENQLMFHDLRTTIGIHVSCVFFFTAWHVSGLNSFGKKGLPRRQGGSWCAAVGLGGSKSKTTLWALWKFEITMILAYWHIRLILSNYPQHPRTLGKNIDTGGVVQTV